MNDDFTMGEREEQDMGKQAKGKENIHVVEPEVMDGRVKPYNRGGKFYELEQDLKATLQADFEYISDVTREMKRISAAKRELFSTLLKNQKEDYVEFQEHMKEQGV